MAELVPDYDAHRARAIVRLRVPFGSRQHAAAALDLAAPLTARVAGDITSLWIAPDQWLLVSDAIEALGMPPGRHRLAGREVIVDESSARLENGVLAGCIIGLGEGVENLATFAGISADEARLAATAVPARLLGLEWPLDGAAA